MNVLAETEKDVFSPRRLGGDHYEATLRSGGLWSGDSALLATLPQGEARLATLVVKEKMFWPEAIAITGVKNSGTEGKEKSGQPPEKKPRMQEDTPDHVLPIASAAAAASERPERATAATATDVHLSSEDNGRDQALVQWLQTHDTEPRCADGRLGDPEEVSTTTSGHADFTQRGHP